MAPPRHVALIPDGNRRWARARGLSVQEGHRAGIANVGRAVDAAWAAGAEVVTFWWGSPANLTLREPAEVHGIVHALLDWLLQVAPELLDSHQAGFQIHGRWQELAPGLAPAVAALPERSGRQLVLLMAYDGRDEVRAAADACGGGGVSEAAFRDALWTGHLPEVDLVIRSGGAPHLSAGFLLWSIAQAQLAFLETPWPAVSATQIRDALADYERRERRFGR